MSLSSAQVPHGSHQTYTREEFMPAQRASEENVDHSEGCQSSGVFPLRLSAFENYMFVDDRPSHPMTFVIEIEVSGDLAADEMRQSIVDSLQRHPLLNARIARRWNGRCWVRSHTPPAIEIVRDGALPQDLPALDLRRGPGLRVWIVPEEEDGRIFFCFHHAATDGLGAMQFIGDAFVEYAHRTSTEDLPERRPIDLRSLRTRACLSSSAVEPGQNPLSRTRVFFRQLGHSASSLA